MVDLILILLFLQAIYWFYSGQPVTVPPWNVVGTPPARAKKEIL